MRQQQRHRVRARWMGYLGAGVLGLLVGCTQPPSADVMLGGTATPSSLPPGPTGSADGLYAGTAALVQGFSCPQMMTISNFRVAGAIVRFGGFQGPVSPDGSVSLTYAGMTLSGRFQGDAFTGRVDTDNDLGIYVRPLRNCIYDIAVRRPPP